MKIDRHNYEEFFILYWDNELAAEQRQAVEDFVKQNADLREEFELLGETRFTPDAEINFKEKEFLLNDSFINITNYEEQLLNYIDGEVSDAERLQIEKFAQLNPAAQKELALLQRTKLQPEAVSFPDKSVLYRKEEKPVRVISMTWFRVAVAAAIIVIAGFTALQLTSNGKNSNVPSKDGSSLANNNSTKKTEIEDQPKISEQSSSTEPAVQNPNNSLTKVEGKSTEKQKEKPVIKTQLPVEQNEIVLHKEPENKNNLPKPRNNFNTNQESSNTDATVAKNNLPVLKRDFDAVEKKQSNDAIFTSTTVTNKPELALDIPETAKEKDGGGLKEFLRKTTRVFERRTKIQTTTEDNKLLVGAFAVSLK